MLLNVIEPLELTWVIAVMVISRIAYSGGVGEVTSSSLLGTHCGTC